MLVTIDVPDHVLEAICGFAAESDGDLFQDVIDAATHHSHRMLAMTPAEREAFSKCKLTMTLHHDAMIVLNAFVRMGLEVFKKATNS